MNAKFEGNSLSCFLKVLLESHNAVNAELIADNAKISSIPPSQSEDEHTPKSAHKLARWSDSSSSLCNESPTSQLQSLRSAVNPNDCVDFLDRNAALGDKTLTRDSMTHKSAVQSSPSLSCPDSIYLSKRSASLDNDRISTSEMVNCKETNVSVKFRRASTGSCAMPSLPVRRKSVQNILNEAIRCTQDRNFGHNAI